MTDNIKNEYLKNNKLVFKKQYSFNNIKGDPCYGIVKNIIFKYKINDYYIEEIYNESEKDEEEEDDDVEEIKKPKKGGVDSEASSEAESDIEDIDEIDDEIEIDDIDNDVDVDDEYD